MSKHSGKLFNSIKLTATLGPSPRPSSLAIVIDLGDPTLTLHVRVATPPSSMEVYLGSSEMLAVGSSVVKR